MTHLEIESMASDYLEGRLAPGQVVEMKAHLAECAPCHETVEDVRRVLEMCQVAEAPEPRPWLVAKILQATVGSLKPTWNQRVIDYLRPILQPRVAYPVAMTVFTFSIIVNAAGLNLRRVHWADLNPNAWVDRANRHGHLMMARAEKYYYDLRVVYEIEYRIRQFSTRPQFEEPPKPESPENGTSHDSPVEKTTAANDGSLVASIDGPVLAYPQARDAYQEMEGGSIR